jgi:hypothetical protein
MSAARQNLCDAPGDAGRPERAEQTTMDLWMYLVVIGMFLVAIVGTVWITLWTIQRGERARGSRRDEAGGHERGAGSGERGAEESTSTNP